MCGVQRRGDLRDDVDGSYRRESAEFGQLGAQRMTFDQTHVDEEDSVDLAPVVYRDHVRFVQGGGGARFSAETSLE
ncbi:hypothetical protein N806_12245 [Rhodococcus sp. P27]|nr:hypothetical protein N806_12245 [Rhodococcus sp. P27]